jgi:hypothetical protein
MNTNSHPSFRSPRVALGNAQRHTTYLKGAIDRFFSDEPYTHRRDVDPETGEDVFKIVLVKEIPDEIFAMAGDAFGNIRECLDQTAYTVATACRLSNTKLKRIYFPFASDSSSMNKAIRDKCSGIPEEIKALYRSFKPYKGGDDALWALNEIANTKKHRYLVPVGNYVGGATFNDISVASCQDLSIMFPYWDGAKNELVYMRGRGLTDFNYEVKVSFDIAVSQIDVLRGQPVIGLLNHLAGRAATIVSQVEAKCVEVGLPVHK